MDRSTIRRIAVVLATVLPLFMVAPVANGADVARRGAVPRTSLVTTARSAAPATLAGATTIITVQSSNPHATTAQLTVWQRRGNRWIKTLGPWTANLGANGWSSPSGRLEGDGTTPTGTYSFGTGFGMAGNPGYQLGWFTIGPTDYWTSDPTRLDYNLHTNGPANPALAPWRSAEHLIDHPVAYRYGAAINFNTPVTGPFGSAIFLHVSTGGPTAGCVSIGQTQLLTLLPRIDRSTRIVMGPTNVIADTLPSEIAYPNGSIVTNAGRYAVMAGGTAIPFGSWSLVGHAGPPTAGITEVSASRWNALTTARPSDGTTLYTLAGPGYVTAGGTPLYVSNWANVGGPTGAVLVDPAGLTRLPPTPADTTKLYTLAGPGYVTAGGTPLYVSNWANVGGPAGAVLVDAAGLTRLPPTPADGTKLYVISGPGFIMASGLLRFVATWADVGGPSGAVLVDSAGLPTS